MLYLNMKTRSALLKVATLIACATSLNISALAQDNDREVFYRVSKSEFAAVVEQMNAGIPATFIIVAPDSWKILPNKKSGTSKPSSLKAYPENADTPSDTFQIIDDGQQITITSDIEANIKFTFKSIAGTYENLSETNFEIYNENGNPLMTAYNGTSCYFFDNESRAQNKYKALFDDNNDHMLNLRTYPKTVENATLKATQPIYINFVPGGSVSSGQFKITGPMTKDEFESATKVLSLYRLDDFNFMFENEDTPEIDGSISITYRTNNVITSSWMYPINLHYILNNGDEVDIEELLASPNYVTVHNPENTDRDKPSNCKIATDGTSTNIWAVPVTTIPSASRSNESLIPVGRIFKGVFAENGGDISTGVITTVADDENAEAEYFTIQGQRASQPLAPGLYIKRQGSKATKIFVK